MLSKVNPSKINRCVYAIALCLRVASHGLQNRQELAGELGIGVDYVESLTRSLKNAGLVRTVRGRHGGVTLAKEPDRTTLAAICAACGVDFMGGRLNKGKMGESMRLAGQALERQSAIVGANLDNLSLARVLAT